jgi:hypothetical protein
LILRKCEKGWGKEDDGSKGEGGGGGSGFHYLLFDDGQEKSIFCLQERTENRAIFNFLSKYIRFSNIEKHF